jgi:hypothetical protein
MEWHTLTGCLPGGIGSQSSSDSWPGMGTRWIHGDRSLQGLRKKHSAQTESGLSLWVWGPSSESNPYYICQFPNLINYHPQILSYAQLVDKTLVISALGWLSGARRVSRGIFRLGSTACSRGHRRARAGGRRVRCHHSAPSHACCHHSEQLLWCASYALARQPPKVIH